MVAWGDQNPAVLDRGTGGSRHIAPPTPRGGTSLPAALAADAEYRQRMPRIASARRESQLADPIPAGRRRHRHRRGVRQDYGADAEVGDRYLPAALDAVRRS